MASSIPEDRAVVGRLADSGNGTITRFAFAYDQDSNPVSQTITLPGNAGSGSNAYSYDRSGRLTSWTRPDSTSVSYAYDEAGNRVGEGSSTYVYDARNRLVSGPEGTYTYDRRGTLRTIDDGANVIDYDFDALGRLASYETITTYTYDALDRLATRDGTAFSYPGEMIDPASDGTADYGRLPSGRLLSVSKGSSDTLAGLNGHGDLAYLFSSTGSVSDTSTYEPFGEVLDETGSTDPSLGFQGDYTDPASDKVWMGARWYAPTWAGFLSRDTLAGELKTSVSLNRYTYANDNPMSYFDPDGRKACRWWGGCTTRGGGDASKSKPGGKPAKLKKPPKPTSAGKKGDQSTRGQNDKANPRKPDLKTLGNTIELEARKKGDRYSRASFAERRDQIAAASLRVAEDAGISDPATIADLAAKAASDLGEHSAVVKAMRTETLRSAISVRDYGTPRSEGSSTWGELASGESLTTAGRAFSNFSAGSVNAAAENLSFGLITPDIESFYDGPGMNFANDVGSVTGFVEAALAPGLGKAKAPVRAPQTADVGLSTRGLRPAPGTRVRPEGVPEGWRIEGTRSASGTRYYDPTNPGSAVRVMQGNSNSPYPTSQSPYVRWQQDGHALDVFGNKLPSPKHPDAHIPLEDFRFLPELFG